MKSAFDIALENYMNHIFTDYVGFQNRSNEAHEMTETRKGIILKMREEFKNGMRYEVGRKYIRVICGSSCHSFIVKKTDGKWKEGDILMAGSWAGPSTNFIRGNILESKLDRVTWTGAQ